MNPVCNPQHHPPLTVALPALLPLQANICPNCKKKDTQSSSAFPQAVKWKAYQLLMLLHVNGQFMKHHATPVYPQSVSTPSNSNPLIKINSNGTVWIRGVQYQPASPPKPTKVSVAEVDVEAAILQPTKGSMPTGLSLTVTQTGP